jgi:hypothetical protein
VGETVLSIIVLSKVHLEKCHYEEVPDLSLDRNLFVSFGEWTRDFHELLRDIPAFLVSKLLVFIYLRYNRRHNRQCEGISLIRTIDFGICLTCLT